ncbi:glycosyltransferase family 4 protein [Lacinutrix sp. MEBiC02595]
MKDRHYVLTKEWARHGKYSGYECLLDLLHFPKVLVKGFFMPYRIAHFFGKRTQLKNYKGETVAKEWRILKQIFKAKTVHVLYGDMDFYYLQYLKRFPFNIKPSKIVATFHHPPAELEKRMGYTRKKVLGTLDKIIVMGSNQIPFFEKYTNAEIRFIPHGIHLDYFTFNPEIKRANKVLIIGVSHRDHQRNIAIIKAVQKIVAIEFLVVMRSEYAVLYQGLPQVEIHTEAVSDDDLLHYYQTFGAVLLSLTDCTASNTILEALACGCPLVVNDVGAVRDYIPKTSGLPVFDTADISGSALYLKELVENKNYSRKISSLQRELALHYDWRIIAKKTKEFIFQEGN